MKKIYLVVVLSLAIACVFALPISREALNWQWAKHKHNEEGYTRYLDRWPTGRHLAQAQLALEDLRWKAAAARNTQAELHSYVKRYPRGRFVVEANARLDEIDWQSASASKSYQGFAAYLRDHPSGLHVQEAAQKAIHPDLAKACRQSLEDGLFPFSGHPGWNAIDAYVDRNPRDPLGLYLKAARFTWGQFLLPRSILSGPIDDLRNALALGLLDKQAALAREFLAVLKKQVPAVPYRGPSLGEPQVDRDPIIEVTDRIAADLGEVCRDSSQSSGPAPPQKPTGEASQTAEVNPAAVQKTKELANKKAAQESKPDTGEAPSVKATGFSRAPLGSPTEIRGTLFNPNPYPITNVHVSFMHIDVGESKDVVLFEKTSVPANNSAVWKTLVTFEKGHPPDALISDVEKWERAPGDPPSSPRKADNK